MSLPTLPTFPAFPTLITSTCTQCSAEFQITKEDMEFLDTMSPEFAGKKFPIPEPNLCPQCREQMRLAYRNERGLYHRKCDVSGQQMISVYSSEKPYKVYEQSVWWSDRFDPLSYGRDFDFSRPFFEQWQELSLAVPRLSIHNAKSENCEYTNYSGENRNCYLVVGGLGSEDSYYSYRVFYSKDIVDCYDVYQCELCYECRECKKLYASVYSDQCHDSSNLAYCSNCIGCSECIGCIGLHQKKHCILNMQYSPEEYQKEEARVLTDMPDFQKKLQELRATIPVKNVRIVNSEDCTGDNIIDSRRCTQCFTMKKSDGVRYSCMGEGNKSCGDCNFIDNCELQWNSANLEKNYRILFANLAWYMTDSIYITSCFNSSHLFGCIGMKKHKHCIFNKQYSEKEYETMAAKIIEHMQKTPYQSPAVSGTGQACEWGQYYPTKYSPFGYNETVAGEEYPIPQETVEKRGWKWFEETNGKEQYLGPKREIPANIHDVNDAVVKDILLCEVTGKPYKIIPQEIAFYRKMGIAIPQKCPDQRHAERMALRNPRKFWYRSCAKCSKEIQTTYQPSRPEIVYCERCYLETVY